MYSELNNLLLSIPGMIAATTLPISSILTWVLLGIGYFLAEISEGEPDIQSLAFFVFVAQIVCNVCYSFFSTPDYFWLTKIFIFFIPYLTLFFLVYYYDKIGRRSDV